jgi:hypothetical protein
MSNAPRSLLSSGLPLAFTLSGATAAGLAVIGYVASRWLGEPEVLPALWSATAAALIGAWAGSIAPLVCLPRPPMQFVAGYFLGLGTRFVVTLLLTLAAYGLAPELAWNALLIWAGLAQAVLLAVDTTVLLRLCAARGGAGQ